MLYLTDMKAAVHAERSGQVKLNGYRVDDLADSEGANPSWLQTRDGLQVLCGEQDAVAYLKADVPSMLVRIARLALLC